MQMEFGVIGTSITDAASKNAAANLSLSYLQARLTVIQGDFRTIAPRLTMKFCHLGLTIEDQHKIFIMACPQEMAAWNY